MKGPTITEWLRCNQLSEKDISFIEAFLTFSSMVRQSTVGEDKVNDTLHSQFSHYQADIKKSITLDQFKSILINNSIDIDAEQLLIRYKNQGICKDFCKYLLRQKDLYK
ncbi:hypothetical protein ACFFGV_04080 [Pontibacillus salicampi]|uniref:Uncharacterized protein n=1 Tax=Pontibacillus salicampi TaxID=1449801 RepID=A0ABV6LKA7_9BACI